MKATPGAHQVKLREPKIVRLMPIDTAWHDQTCIYCEPLSIECPGIVAHVLAAQIEEGAKAAHRVHADTVALPASLGWHVALPTIKKVIWERVLAKAPTS